MSEAAAVSTNSAPLLHVEPPYTKAATSSSTIVATMDDSSYEKGSKAQVNPKPDTPPSSPLVNESEKKNPEPNAEDNRLGSGEDDSKYPGPLALGLITVALCLAVFLVALDQTIIATAIPKIADDFKSLGDVGWYGSAYMLTMCSFQLLYGKLYSFFSLKWCFLIAIGIFEAGSLICGLAPNSVTLIVGRAVAGLGCAGIFSGALIIIAHSVPLRKRPIYSGLTGAMFGIASVAGPLMGGAFTDHATWRWCFFINLPVGAVAIVVIILCFQPPHRTKIDNLTTKQKLAEFDFIGTLALLPGIICLLLALQWGGSKYPWKSGRIIGLIVASAILVCGFVAIQFWRGDKATLPPRIISQRSIMCASLVSFGVGAAFLVIVFYLPLWFQVIKGVSATKSGIMNLPLILSVTIFSILAGGLVTWFGYYVPFMLAGAVLAIIGAGLLTTFEVNTGHSKWIGYQFVAGAGIGLIMQQPITASQTVLELKDIPIGTAAIVFSQTLGGALFISVGQNVFNNKLISGLAKTLPEIDPVVILATGATSIRTSFPKEWLPVIMIAYNAAITNIFYAAVAMSAVAFLACLGMEWASVKGKKIETIAI